MRSSTLRSAAQIAFVALHPLLALAIFAGGASEQPLVEVAYIIELVFTGGFAYEIARRLEVVGHHEPTEPRNTRWTHDGFSTQLSLHPVPGNTLAVSTGLLVVSAGTFALLMLADARLEGGALGVVPLLVGFGAGHLVFQAMLGAVVFVLRGGRDQRRTRQTVELTGNVLRVAGTSHVLGSELETSLEPDRAELVVHASSGDVVIYGGMGELRWLDQILVQAARGRDGADASEVPNALAHMRDREVVPSPR